MILGNLHAVGFLTATDVDTGEVLIDKTNAIHFENLSEALANSIANNSVGRIYAMAFGNGGTTVDTTGLIVYNPPNAIGQNADLYNPTYLKVVDNKSAANVDASRNKVAVVHSAGKPYTDILISCLLDYGEPSGQQAFDNSADLSGDYVFDEMAIKVWNGSADNLKLVTHVVFHPTQKSLNRRIKIDYTIRVQTLTHLTSGASE